MDELAVPPSQAQPAPPSSTPPSVHSLSLLRDVGISIVLAIFVIVFVYQPVKVEGTSMMPGLLDQDRIFINKYTYAFGLGNIQRGDLVVFEYPNDISKKYIKRVIGLPGDYVEIYQGRVMVNGYEIVESYVPPAYRDEMTYPRKLVPLDQYFVLGDHRSSSNDSRMWGTVDRKYIYGKAVFVYWPFDQIGRVH